VLRQRQPHQVHRLREKFVQIYRVEKDHCAKQFSYLLDSLLALRVHPL